MSTYKPTVASLFAGAGGLDLGFKWASYDLAWANEISEDAAATYQKHVDDHIVVGDIQDHLSKIPTVDIVIGGPPCQSFSLVGKRISDDPRGQLVFAFQEAVRNARPYAFVMENVLGLLACKIDGERLTTHLACEFATMGYQVELIKLTATDFFVPQRRNRVFMVGWKVRDRFDRLKSAPAKVKTLFSANAPCVPAITVPVSVADALDDLPLPAEKGYGPVPYKEHPQSAFAHLMRQNTSVAVTLQEMPTMSKLDREFVRHIPPGGNYQDIPDSISTKRIMNFKRTGGRTTTYGRLHPDKPAYTVNTYFNRPNVGANYHHEQERLITVREALRLQSFPDWFTPIYSTQRSLHAQVGNAVPPFMAYGIAASLRELLGFAPNPDRVMVSR